MAGQKYVDLVDEDDREATTELDRAAFVEIYLDDSDDDDVVELPPPTHRTTNTGATFRRNGPIVAPLEELEFVEFYGKRLKPGNDVEVLGESDQSCDFLRIKHIIRNPAGEITLRGLKFRRSKHLPFAANLTNEVCLIAEVCKDDSRPLFEQALEECKLSDVLRKRRLVISRDPFPMHSFRALGRNFDQRDPKVKDEERLVCRYVYSPTYETAWNPKLKRRPKAVEGVIRRVLESESDVYDGDYRDERPIDMEKLRSGDITYGSGFCGAGGDVTGAKMAGMKALFAFDHWETACKTCQINHPEVRVYVRDQADAISSGSEKRIEPPKDLTVCHCSFPCRCFSPAHTVSGKDDDKNDALILATGAHLQYWKPLIHTQEQTAGLMSHHPDWFFAVISGIVEERYNVRWKLCRLEEHGLPALRKRLIIFAARDDIPLPHFPAPEYGPAHGGKPFRTIWEYAGRVPPDATCHLDMAGKPFEEYRERTPYDPKTTMAKCLTTNGGQSYHWSGKCNLTPRQRARLQTFRNSYWFEGNAGDVNRQVGNAVPPLVWKAFMDVIVKTLRDWAHGRIDAQGNPVQGAPATPTALPQQQARARSMSSLSSMTEIDSVMVDADDDVLSVADDDVVSVAVDSRRVIVID